MEMMVWIPPECRKGSRGAMGGVGREKGRRQTTVMEGWVCIEEQM